ncbi:MAG: hypothetical protein JWO10_1664 [Microbacteriaceae bacterium]|nr:hypothetical protein [Microbacteriaceae bacterium]
MNPDGFAQVFKRRWWILVLGVIVAGALGYFAYAHSHPTYERTASRLLLPGQASYPIGDNPYVHIDDLDQASDVLIDVLSSDKVQGSIEDAFPDATIVIERNSSTKGPIVSITVTSQSDAATGKAMDRILAQLPTSLNQLQDDAEVPADARISVVSLTSDTESTVDQGERFRQAGLAVGGVLLVTIIVTFIVDNVLGALSARRRRREGAPGAVLEPTTVDDARPRAAVGADDQVNDVHPAD